MALSSLFGKKPQVTPLARTSRTAGKAGPAAISAEDGEPLDFYHTHSRIPDSKAGQRKVEVQEVTHGIPQAIEEAAMLYSIDQAAAATGILEAAIRDDDLGDHTHRAWGMLFELYQSEGRRRDFDQLAAEYTARFEISPPVWMGAAPEGPVATAKPKPASKSAINLLGVLNAESKETLQQVFKAAEKSPSVRLDVSKLTDADNHGCGLLNAVLRRLKKARKECVIAGAEKLAALLAKKTKLGESRDEQIWLLLLAIYQQLGKQKAFEDAAVDYAVTFEVSPPSFEMPEKDPLAKPEPEAEAEVETAEIKDAVCALKGVITSAGETTFAAIRAEAATTPEVIVDAGYLKRMDFVSATNLMNIVTELLVIEKRVRFIKASHLLAALWEVIGLDRVARIETRKI
ncbi:MAG: hypothetical protein LBP94_07285 [Zoogloeaceae bacterium]|nr:hypothetical protein [Zoogloeaceae bacterium]